MDEEHPLNPRSPYAATKAGGDRLAYCYFVTYGLPVVIVRPFNNYGPRQHPGEGRAALHHAGARGEPLTIHGEGHASRDWLHVDDDAEAIEAIIDAPLDRVAGEVVNVATGVDISVRDIADARARRGRQARRDDVHVDERPGQVDRHIGSTDKLERLTGWRARTASRKGSSARSPGTARTRPGGGRPRTRPRLLVLGAGPAQLGLLGARGRGRWT